MNKEAQRLVAAEIIISFESLIIIILLIILALVYFY